MSEAAVPGVPATTDDRQECLSCLRREGRRPRRPAAGHETGDGRASRRLPLPVLRVGA